ncbi:hypothetical protein KTR66_04565 [Roseococcus sp. SDR]|uniref:hypothetical protein n=1 Tax=Roseococcus sp. SDR TaxID=2835532 RepID=UPI001BCABF68|nr:hypothetical protein [Roseococcus sp. SDR]MBS7789252.1 hypothetical protein [Roseococcus sp. SDR]MBV1844566.1 hypothetical protein [Roseococcus sp. SDR]
MHMLTAHTLSMTLKPAQTPAMDQLAHAAAREWIETLARTKGTNASKLAAHAGLAPSAVTRAMKWENGKPLTQNTLQALATAWHVPAPDQILRRLPLGRDRSGIKRTVKALAALPPRTPVGEADVPLWGAVMSAWDHLFHLNRTPLSYATRPPGAQGVRALACMYMPDDSMAPWRVMGERIYLDPTRPIRTGDHALVEVADVLAPNNEPLAFIALNTAQGWRQYAPRTPINMNRWKVLARFRVLEWSELVP